MIKDLKDMYNIIMGGKSFETFVTDYYEDFAVERVGDYAYVDQDFYDFCEELGAEIIIDNGKLTDTPSEVSEQDFYVLSKDEFVLIIPCQSYPNRHGEDLADETVLNFEQMTLCERIKFATHLDDKRLGEILDYVDQIEENWSYVCKSMNTYITWSRLTGEFDAYDLNDLTEGAAEYLEDNKENDKDQQYLDYLKELRGE